MKILTLKYIHLYLSISLQVKLYKAKKNRSFINESRQP